MYYNNTTSHITLIIHVMQDGESEKVGTGEEGGTKAVGNQVYTILSRIQCTMGDITIIIRDTSRSW